MIHYTLEWSEFPNTIPEELSTILQPPLEPLTMDDLELPPLTPEHLAAEDAFDRACLRYGRARVRAEMMRELDAPDMLAASAHQMAISLLAEALHAQDILSAFQHEQATRDMENL